MVKTTPHEMTTGHLLAELRRVEAHFKMLKDPTGTGKPNSFYAGLEMDYHNAANRIEAMDKVLKRVLEWGLAEGDGSHGKDFMRAWLYSEIRKVTTP